MPQVMPQLAYFRQRYLESPAPTTMLWDVAIVLNYIESSKASEALPLFDLTWKLAMLMVLTGRTRSADLVQLDLRFRQWGCLFRKHA